MTATKQFYELKKKLAALKKEAKDFAKAAFKEMAAEVFTKHPTLKSFSWNQYTPHFNDGDECVFSANVEEPNIEIIGADGIIREIEGYDIPSDTEWNGVLQKSIPRTLTPDELVQIAAFDGAVAFLRSFENNDFEEMFGNHVEVSVSRDGVEIAEYEHD